MTALQGPFVRLVMLGIGPRLAVAALIIVLLWAGFLWATSPVAVS